MTQFVTFELTQQGQTCEDVYTGVGGSDDADSTTCADPPPSSGASWYVHTSVPPSRELLIEGYGLTALLPASSLVRPHGPSDMCSHHIGRGEEGGVLGTPSSSACTRLQLTSLFPEKFCDNFPSQQAYFGARLVVCCEPRRAAERSTPPVEPNSPPSSDVGKHDEEWAREEALWVREAPRATGLANPQ